MPITTPLSVTVLQGPGGFARLASRGRFDVPDPRGYEATWRSMHVDGLQLSEWSTTPIAGVVLLSTEPAVALIAVRDGELDCRSVDHHATISAGQLCALDAAKKIRFAIRRRARLLRIVVPQAVLPAQLLPLDGFVCTPGPTPLSQTLASLVGLALDSTPDGTLSPACRALRALTVAMLEELVPPVTTPDLRTEMVAYIERNLTDPQLTPGTIAEAFGISLRWVHHLFDTEDDSVARFIRLRRLDRVAAELTADRRFPRINHIAQRHGFTSREGLTRAFKARYGMSIADFAELAARGRAPLPRDAPPDRTGQ